MQLCRPGRDQASGCPIAPWGSAIVVVIILPVEGIPLVTGVFVVTSITVGITYPPSGATVVLPVSVFGFFPTSIAVVVTLDADAVVAVRVASLVSVRGRRCR